MRKFGLKIAALLLSVVFVFAVFPSLKSNADMRYILENGILTITGDGEVNSDYVYSAAHNNRSSVTSVVLGSGITSIGPNAFNGCDNLGSVTIPDTVKSIGRSAFYGCRSLTSVEIPSNVEVIDQYAFCGCSSLTSVAIPVDSKVGSIGRYAFEGCASLTSIVIPSSVKSIGEYAFYPCRKLESLTINEGVESIGEYAFAECESLTSIKLPNSITSIGTSAFRQCSGLTSVEIPGSLTSISDNVFYNCTNLESVKINEGVKSIGEYAFYECTKLTSVEFPDSITSIGGSAFDKCTSLTSIKLPKSVTSIGNSAFAKTGITEIVIPDSVTIIDCAAFYKCSSLTSVKIPANIQTINSSAFGDCSNLKVVIMPDPSTIETDYGSPFKDSPADIEFHYYYNATYSCEHGTIEGNEVTFGTDKLTIKPEENYELDEVSYTFAGSNEKTIIIPDANGDYRMPDLDASITNRNIVVTASFKLIQKTVTFCDEDGTTILQSGKVDATTIPTYGGDTPTKPADAQYTYTFYGWTDGTDIYKYTDELPEVTKDTSYTAVYESALRKYTVTFTDDSGKELLSSDVKYGEAPKYTGDTPTKAETDKYTYTFAGWIDGANNKYGPTDTLPEVKGDVTYKAVFTETAKPEPDEPQKPVDPTTTDPQKTDEPATVDPVDPVVPVVPVDPDEPEVAPVKPVVDPDIKPVTTEVDVKKPGVYYLNSLTGDGVTTDVVAAIKRTEDDVHCVEYFGNAEVDGTPMTVGEQILVGSGSTIITIKKEFLATIGEGTHTLKVLFTDGGSITIEFTVKAAANNAANVPSTGESMSMTTVLGAGLILGACGVVVAFATRKRKEDA